MSFGAIVYIALTKAWVTTINTTISITELTTDQTKGQSDRVHANAHQNRC